MEKQINKRKTLHVRLSETEYKKLEKTAYENDRNLSEFVRDLIRNVIK